MNLNLDVYTIKNEEETLRYFFNSDGHENIPKVIEYQYIQPYKKHFIYNLAFGNYDIEKDELLDDVVSNNGDATKVFNTVLSSIPTFFENDTSKMLMVQGSDSTQDFYEACYDKCIKKCERDKCRKFKQRLRIYTNYINANYDELINEYEFYGGVEMSNGQISLIEYKIVDKDNYIGIFITKKI